ncbi:MAG: type I-MYXAN CRISPR-associated protein Cas6/Cmx6 [Synechocystis sp.]
MTNFIDLSFPVKGTVLNADHNYYLYSAIAKEFPVLHNLPNLAINAISGKPDREGKILLIPGSKLWMRLPVENIAHIYQLAGKTLRIGQYSIALAKTLVQPWKRQPEISG